MQMNKTEILRAVLDASRHAYMINDGKNYEHAWNYLMGELSAMLHDGTYLDIDPNEEW